MHAAAPSASPRLLRRLAALEASVDRLQADLSKLRSALVQAPAPARGAGAAAGGGLAGAVARGEAARVQWVREGLVVPGERLAAAWGLTRQALAPAAGRGELFALKIGNRLYYPAAFLALERDAVARVCRALGDLDAATKTLFWLRAHGALGGRTPAAALAAGVPAAKAERLAAAWARERGAARAAAA